MQIKSVTVGLSLTESLPDYNNVKPSLTITADIDPGENVDNVVNFLFDELVRAYVEGHVDDAREAAGQSPKFYQGPLYKLLFWQQRDALVILPESVEHRTLPGDWFSRSPGHSAMRLTTIRDHAAEMAAPHGYEILDCPPVADLLAWWHAQAWYVACGLVAWRDHYDYDFAHTLFVRHDLSRPKGLKEFDNCTLRTLHAYTTDHFPKLSDSADWTVVDDQATLDRLVADWLAGHPRPKVETL
jgi:hypothetical protein